MAKKTKKKPAPRPALKKVPKTPISEIAPEEQIVGAVFLGKVRGFASNLAMMSLVLEAPLAAGDAIRIKGKNTDLTQRVERMEVDGAHAHSADAGDAVSIEVADRVTEGDAVYKV